jgi:hypothetical protein
VILLSLLAFQILGLDDCADTLAGDAMKKGISGGEKRRLTTGYIECKIVLALPC